MTVRAVPITTQARGDRGRHFAPVTALALAVVGLLSFALTRAAMGRASRISPCPDAPQASHPSRRAHRTADIGPRPASRRLELLGPAPDVGVRRSTAARYAAKAQILKAAWRVRFGTDPTLTATLNAMAVAELETEMGDAWAGENNWGAILKRGVTADEAKTLRRTGLRATQGMPSLVAARQLLEPGDNEVLHRDWLPGNRAFFAWFWAFETPLEGATKFLDVFVAKTKGVRAIIAWAPPEKLARVMFEGGYYTGTHADDPEANIAAYATRLRFQRSAIQSRLAPASERAWALPTQ